MLHLRILLIIALIATISFQGSAEVIWQRDFERAKQIAQEEQKFMLVDFWAWWCGPCKKMDSEVWSQDGITQLAHKFIPVKVDLDADKSTSNAYRVSAIPTMMILDPYGEVVWQSTGYMGFDQVQDLLTTFPSDASFIAESTAKIKADDKDQKAYLNLALAYQEKIPQLEGLAHQSYLSKSDQYLSDAAKYAGKADDGITEEKAEILEMINQAYRGKGSKAVEKFEKKVGIENIKPENKAVAYYALSVCAREDGNNKDATKYMQALSTSPGAENWMRLLEDDEIKTP